MYVYEIRYQTGELAELTEDLRNGLIPKLDCDNEAELNWCLSKLAEMGIVENKSIARDPYAIDRNKFYDYEFRIAFNIDNTENIGYVDIYFEEILDDDYDPVCEM